MAPWRECARPAERDCRCRRSTRKSWPPGASVLAPLSGIADVGLLALLGAALAAAVAKSAHRALVGGVVVSLVRVGVLSMITNYITLFHDPPVPGRHGLSVLPFAAVAIAPVVRRYVLASASDPCLEVVAAFFADEAESNISPARNPWITTERGTRHNHNLASRYHT